MAGFPKRPDSGILPPFPPPGLLSPVFIASVKDPSITQFAFLTKRGVFVSVDLHVARLGPQLDPLDPTYADTNTLGRSDQDQEQANLPFN